MIMGGICGTFGAFVRNIHINSLSHLIILVLFKWIKLVWPFFNF